MKRKLYVSALGLMLTLLSACGGTKRYQTVSLDPQPIAMNTVSDDAAAPSEPEAALISAKAPDSAAENETSQTETPAAETQTPAVLESPADAYRELYIQAAAENSDSAAVFSLIYLDDDEIPELAVENRGDEICSIYTVKDGELFPLLDSMRAAELTYFEKTGVLARFERWNGGGDEGGYGLYYYLTSKDRTLTDDDAPVLSRSYNAVYDEAGNYTGEGITSYYYMDEETDEASFRDALRALGIGENNGSLLGDALQKEDLIRLLSQ